MRTLSRFALCAVVATILLSGCSRGGSRGGLFGGTPQSTFPVYSPSTVTTVGKYDDSEEVTKLGSSFFGQGADETKPYIGTQELIKTSASIDELEAWMKKLVQSPPQDLYASEATIARESSSTPGPGETASAAPTGTGSAPPADAGSPTPLATATVGPRGTTVYDTFAEPFKMFGLVPFAFWSKDRGRVVMIIIMDPKQVADHLGATLDVLDQYEKMPAFLRGGIDATIKKQAGFSASDLMNTNTPMGMIVFATRNWKTEDSRAIILVDAQRGPNDLPTPHNT